MRISRLQLSTPLIAILALTLVGCGTFSNDKVDYKTGRSSKTGPDLTIPPDLVTAQADRRYIVQDGTATMSEYNQAIKKVDQSKTNVLTGIPGMRIERDGERRWLVVDKPAKDLYPQIKDFWQENGFLLLVDSPSTGIMETDWAENRAKIPQDFIRQMLGKVIDSLYDTGERDKYRTRLEPNSSGGTEVYITQKGAVEKCARDGDGSCNFTVWQARPNDPELEAVFLARLMERLGLTQEQAKAQVANATVIKTPKAQLVEEGSVTRIDMNQSFDRAWRDVGLALDRSNFTVEDRDRSKGIYYVRYVNQKDTGEKKGWFSRTFGSDDETTKKAKLYRIYIQRMDENKVQIFVQDADGKPENTSIGNQVLTTLDRQLIR
ncbi:MAG: outer membrane protein assembly factor BamC [Polynucleobacter sp.]|jgi:outer membrane protein assembly factor BamC|nr:outer membrane protein assembly factor BamC [Polynucleobacter sp.]